MCLNSSSSSNDFLIHPNLSSIHFSFGMECFISRPGSIIVTSFFITYILILLPLSIFIIYHGLQQWRKTRSTSSAAAMSHSDSFTYNMVTMELIGVFGSVLCCCGVYSYHGKIFLVGYCLMTFNCYGETFFHILTCVERYLAVVHPITYLSLRKERGIRIRNISICCVWLLSVAETSLTEMEQLVMIVNFTLLMLTLAIISFCSLSVLCVLIRPGPGEQGGGRERVGQSKQRAFYIIMIILGVLVLRFTWNLVWAVMFVSGRVECVITSSGFWFNLPSSLVLPLLFLLRAGNLLCWKNKISE